MSITLRPYQNEAINAIMGAIEKDRFLLLQAATGAGKTILFSELIKRFLSDYQMRICVLAHRRELITQAADKLKTVWSSAPIGVACAGISKNVQLDTPIVIGSIQTLSRRLNKTSPFHMLIVDEVHRLPPKNDESQYSKFIAAMEAHYPDLRVLGVTATPYRLKTGYIYGDECKIGTNNWFPCLHYKVGIRTLQEQGYLCGIRAKEAENIDLELAGIKLSGGDYNIADLSDLMSAERHVGSAVHAYEEYGEGRSHVLVFAVTIEHAQRLMEAFEAAGYAAGCVHSKMSSEARDQTLQDYANGRINVLTNVGVLQEGWDSPHTDCILMCRPTKSPALYVQQIGRALRIHPGKQDMLILDLSGNIHRHGNPDSPVVLIPSLGGKPPKQSTKTCPSCKTIVHARLMECLECGYLWPEPEIVERNEPINMREIDFNTPIIEPPKPRTVKIEYIEPQYYTSKAGNRMLKIIVTGLNGGNYPLHIYHFLDIEGNGSFYGQEKAERFWVKMDGKQPVPETISEALNRFNELSFPGTVEVKEDGKYLKIKGW